MTIKELKIVVEYDKCNLSETNAVMTDAHELEKIAATIKGIYNLGAGGSLDYVREKLTELHGDLSDGKYCRED